MDSDLQNDDKASGPQLNQDLDFVEQVALPEDALDGLEEGKARSREQEESLFLMTPRRDTGESRFKLENKSGEPEYSLVRQNEGLVYRLSKVLRRNAFIESRVQFLSKENQKLSNKNIFLQDQYLILKEEYEKQSQLNNKKEQSKGQNAHLHSLQSRYLFQEKNLLDLKREKQLLEHRLYSLLKYQKRVRRIWGSRQGKVKASSLSSEEPKAGPVNAASSVLPDLKKKYMTQLQYNQALSQSLNLWDHRYKKLGSWYREKLKLQNEDKTELIQSLSALKRGSQKTKRIVHEGNKLL